LQHNLGMLSAAQCNSQQRKQL